MNFLDLIKDSPVILGEGDKSVRLKFEFGFTPDQQIGYSSLVYSEEGRAAIRKIFRQYWNIAEKYNLPAFARSPTWRANPERVSKSPYASKNVVDDILKFMFQLRDEMGLFASRIAICGILAPKGDAYDPKMALSEEEAFNFHAYQIEQMAKAGADVVSAGPLPSLSEAMGIARRMSALNVTGCISFIVKSTGSLLDGTPLHEAICRIDDQIETPPCCYMVNCVHPVVLVEALAAVSSHIAMIKGRLLGIFGNASKKRPDELDDLDRIESDDPSEFASATASLHKLYGLKILGGCCGTDDRYIEAIAKEII